MEGLIDGYSMDDALEVTNIEEVANHDVKALNISLKRNARRFPRLKILSYLPEIACHVIGFFCDCLMMILLLV